MNGTVVGQASRLPLGRLAPKSIAGQTPAQAAGTAAPLPLAPGSWGALGEGRLGTVKGRMARSMFGEFSPRGTRTPPFARLRCQAAARTSLQMGDRRSGFNET